MPEVGGRRRQGLRVTGTGTNPTGRKQLHNKVPHPLELEPRRDVAALTFMSIILRFFPNGEFTQGVDTSHRRKSAAPKEHKHEPLTQECRDGYMQWVQENPNADIHLCVPGQQFTNQRGEIYTYLCEDVNGHHYALEGENFVLPDVLINEPIGRMVARGEMTPLVYQTLESSAQRKNGSRKRLERMTKHMARNIRNAGYLLQAKYGKDNISFATFTLPSLSECDLATCCERWDDIVDNFLHSIRKRVKKHGVEFEYVYCTEIQPKRLEKRHEYAPHLHIALRGRSGKKKPWYVSSKQFRSAWGNSIANILGHNDFDRRALENVQRVKHSVSGYLSKYLSKGSNSNTTPSACEVHSRLRTQWGGMARTLCRQIRESTRRYSSEGDSRRFVVSFLSNLDELLKASLLSFYKAGFIVLSVCRDTGMERGIKVCCGCLSTPSAEGGIDRVREYLMGTEPKEIRNVTKLLDALDKRRMN